jgi:hypothetical protein
MRALFIRISGFCSDAMEAILGILCVVFFSLILLASLTGITLALVRAVTR